ncbi:hypothetical protein [Arthrobacter zhaoxinii]|uniref:hypothetical protein n=1 Tax=Arthrobacter zhaoxinii TaxID=2964616 RepID=UPI0021048FC8|nr:hypothetical protein [Arthrobacter zhaoxinii]MCQ2000999.1 hypothetical protein [Arthrobacter zhaoxinii]
MACWTGSKVVVTDDWDLIWKNGAPLRWVAREYASMEDWFLAASQDFIEHYLSGGGGSNVGAT